MASGSSGPFKPRVAFATSDEEDNDVTTKMTSPYEIKPPKPSDDVTKRKKRSLKTRPSSASAVAVHPSTAPSSGNQRKRISSSSGLVTTEGENLMDQNSTDEVNEDKKKEIEKEITESKPKLESDVIKEKTETSSTAEVKKKRKRKKRRNRDVISPDPTSKENLDESVESSSPAPTNGNPPRYLPPVRDAIPEANQVCVGTTTSTVLAPLVPGMTSHTSYTFNNDDDVTKPKLDVIEHKTTKSDVIKQNEAYVMNETNEYVIDESAMTSLAMGKIDDNKKLKSTLHFHDGKKKIDFVMAYIETTDDDADDVDSDDVSNKKRRHVYEAALKNKGLEIEIEPKEESQDQMTCFVKIHVPYEVLLTYAERMRMKMPLKEDKENHDEGEHQDDSCGCNFNMTACCTQPFRLDNPELEDREEDNFTAEFVKDKIEFFDVKDEATFFSDSQRSRIAYRIMNETRFGDDKTMVGITKLINDGTYDCVFPLHDGAYDVDKLEIANQQNMRGLLYREWGRWGRWYKFQPLDAIRKYFGDKIALYFAWLGFYTEMLIYPTIVGLCCMIYSVISLATYAPVKEVCDPTYPTYAGDLVMCPQCDKDCGYWNLSTSCVAAEITHIFDNNSTIFFAIFMSLWATTFLEVWKRRQFKLNYEWDLVDYDEERDLIRPEFEAKVSRERINPVTKKMEPFLSAADRFTRVCFSAVTVFFWVLVVCAAVIAVIIYRIVISSVFATSIDPDSLGAIGTYATPSLLTTVTGSLLSLILIMILNTVYEKIAIWLTDLELPRTQIEFEDSFTFKMFCFQFVNYYSYLFYVAFLKNLLAGLPPHYNYFVGTRWEECDAGGCMYELSLQLVIIMFGKQLWNNIVEIVWPWGVTKYNQWRSAMTTQTSPENMYTRWEQDYDLQPFQQLALFYEYLEMVIQFGFATLFVSAFPLAPALALINNIFEIRLDANKLICESRRPVAQKCSDIGVWYYLLDFLGTLAVITNAFTIAFTSQSIPKLVYYYVYSLDYYSEQTMQGFTNNSLAVFDVNDFSEKSKPASNPDNVQYCRYRAYRTPATDPNKYETTKQYWHTIAAQLAFVIVMEHVVMLCKWLIDYIVPDRPKELQTKIKREHYLVQEVLVKAEASSLLKKQRFSMASSEQLGDDVNDASTSQPNEYVINNQPTSQAVTSPQPNNDVTTHTTTTMKIEKETTEL